MRSKAWVNRHHDGTVEGYWLVPCLSNMNVVTVEFQRPSHSMATLEATPESIILRSSLLVRELGVSPDVVQKVRHHRGEEAAKDLFSEGAGEPNGSMILGFAARLRWLGTRARSTSAQLEGTIT